MRSFLATILVLLLGSCPIVCGTSHSSAEGDGHACRHADRAGKSSLPTPANDDDCLCNGALKASYGDLGLDVDAGPSPWHGFLSASLVPPSLPPGACPSASPPGTRGRAPVRDAARSPLLRC